MLLEGGADVGLQDNAGQSPLHLASSRGHVNVVRVLLAGGADALAQDKDGRTPFRYAVSKGHLHVTRVLLQHNAYCAIHTMTCIMT